MRFIFTLFGVLTCFWGSAQSIYDAVSASTSRSSSTARVAGMGGAYGSTGPEIGAISTNPATLGLFRTDVFSFTSNLQSNRSNTEFAGNRDAYRKSNFGFTSMGFVKGRDFEDTSRSLKSMNYALSFNRNNTFREYFSAGGVEVGNSMVDYFAAQANDPKNVTRSSNFLRDNAPFMYESYLANQTNLISNINSIDFEPIYNTNASFRKSVISAQKGNQFNFSFSAGGNINDKFFIGGSINGEYLRINYENTYREEDEQDTITNFNNFSFRTNTNFSGFGASFQLGGIYVVEPNFRIGIGYKSRTSVSAFDSYSTSLSSNLDSIGPFQQRSMEYNGSYTLFLPDRFTFSATQLFDKIGLISADMDITNMRRMEFRSEGDPFAFDDLNQTIQDSLGTAIALRLGGEYRFDKKYYGRAGFRYQTMGWGTENQLDNIRYALSLGLGIKNENEIIDLALIQNFYQSSYTPFSGYNLQGPKARANILPVAIMLTITSKI
jgi:long-subunit fatty acid transport protein